MLQNPTIGAGEPDSEPLQNNVEHYYISFAATPALQKDSSFPREYRKRRQFRKLVSRTENAKQSVPVLSTILFHLSSFPSSPALPERKVHSTYSAGGTEDCLKDIFYLASGMQSKQHVGCAKQLDRSL
jgi:hypothetical protein